MWIFINLRAHNPEQIGVEKNFYSLIQYSDCTFRLKEVILMGENGHNEGRKWSIRGVKMVTFEAEALRQGREAQLSCPSFALDACRKTVDFGGLEWATRKFPES